jgi:S1 RNA binding domain protein
MVQMRRIFIKIGFKNLYPLTVQVKGIIITIQGFLPFFLREDKIYMSIAVGTIVDGVVTGITKFGAFVKLEDGTVGLVHISEVADAYVKDINEFLKENEQIKVKVVSIGENGKVGLSIKQATVKPASRPAPVKPDLCFEDKLADFMKDSNEKLVALKRHQEGRRGR